MSPILGISENNRLLRVGKIHLGVKVINKSGNGEHPEATDYFVVPPEVEKIYGPTPKELPVMIPTDDDELWCSQYYRRYSSTRGLVCKGDGVTCRRMIDTKTGDIAHRDTKEIFWKEGMACLGQQCPDYIARDCKEVMNLQFILPDVPGLGVWQIDTGSINSIRNINAAAHMIRVAYGKISFIPLLLTLEPIDVVNPDDGKKKTVKVLNFRVRSTMRELMVEATKTVARAMLPPPSEDEAPRDELAKDTPDDTPKFEQLPKIEVPPASKKNDKHEKAPPPIVEQPKARKVATPIPVAAGDRITPAQYNQIKADAAKMGYKPEELAALIKSVTLFDKLEDISKIHASALISMIARGTTIKQQSQEQTQKDIDKLWE